MYNFLYSNKFWLVRHSLFWIVFYLDEFLSFFGITEDLGAPIAFLFGVLLDVFMVYFNFYYLIPQFFQKGKVGIYILLTFLMLFANIFAIYYWLIPPCEECDIFYDLFQTFLSTAGLLGIAIAIKISKLNYLKQERLNELQQLQLTTELNYLKKQINPHFLFNVLNNIYVQARENSKDVPESILKLSELMRYQTYDAAKEKVSLNQEIDFLKKYLDMEKMRREHLKININENGDFNNISIPPLLFLPFVENACKHSALLDSSKETINIDWTILNDQLHFKIENTIGQTSGHLGDDEYSGFGLENIKKRIQLIYPDNHQLSIKEDDNLFKVALNIDIE